MPGCRKKFGEDALPPPLPDANISDRTAGPGWGRPTSFSPSSFSPPSFSFSVGRAGAFPGGRRRRRSRLGGGNAGACGARRLTRRMGGGSVSGLVLHACAADGASRRGRAAPEGGTCGRRAFHSATNGDATGWAAAERGREGGEGENPNNAHYRILAVAALAVSRSGVGETCKLEMHVTRRARRRQPGGRARSRGHATASTNRIWMPPPRVPPRKT